jgi:hypothetical protein
VHDSAQAQLLLLGADKAIRPPQSGHSIGGCMNSSRGITQRAVSSRQDAFSLSTTWPRGAALQSFVGQRRAGDAAAQFLERLPDVFQPSMPSAPIP